MQMRMRVCKKEPCKNAKMMQKKWWPDIIQSLSEQEFHFSNIWRIFSDFLWYLQIFVWFFDYSLFLTSCFFNFFSFISEHRQKNRNDCQTNKGMNRIWHSPTEKRTNKLTNELTSEGYGKLSKSYEQTNKRQRLGSAKGCLPEQQDRWNPRQIAQYLQANLNYESVTWRIHKMNVIFPNCYWKIGNWIQNNVRFKERFKRMKTN